MDGRDMASSGNDVGRTVVQARRQRLEPKRHCRPPSVGSSGKEPADFRSVEVVGPEFRVAVTQAPSEFAWRMAGVAAEIAVQVRLVGVAATVGGIDPVRRLPPAEYDFSHEPAPAKLLAECAQALSGAAAEAAFKLALAQREGRSNLGQGAKQPRLWQLQVGLAMGMGGMTAEQLPFQCFLAPGGLSVLAQPVAQRFGQSRRQQVFQRDIPVEEAAGRRPEEARQLSGANGEQQHLGVRLGPDAVNAGCRTRQEDHRHLPPAPILIGDAEPAAGRADQGRLQGRGQLIRASRQANLQQLPEQGAQGGRQGGQVVMHRQTRKGDICYAF